MVLYVIGFLGSDRTTPAKRIAAEQNIPCYDLYEEIEKREGRSVQRLVIAMGEHELRNKEYEALTAILSELGETVSPAKDEEEATLPTICSRCASMEQAANPAESDICDSGDLGTAPINGTFTAVIICGDDTILDPMSAALIRKGAVLVADDDPEEMFQRIKDDTTTHYAFLLDDDENRKRDRFFQLYRQRKPLYTQLGNTL